MRRFTRQGLLAIDPQSWGLDFAPMTAMPKLFAAVGDTAVVSISGPLTQHDECSWWGCDNYDSIRERVAAALESSATSVVLRIDSPGGDCAGNFELARWIRETATAAGKRVFAFTDSLAASAAYSLACAADGGIFISSTARVGSVGTIMVSVDQTAADQAYGLRFTVVSSGAHKADGHPHVPISKDAIAEMQSQIDVYASMFFDHVAAMRSGLTADAVKALEARVLIGETAVTAGLADGVTTFDGLLAMVASGASTTELSGAKGSKQMDFEEMLAALKEKAKGEGDEAEQAKKMLKAIGKDDDASAEGEEEGAGEKDEEAPASSKKDAKGEDEEEDGASATAGGASLTTIGALSAQVQKLEAKLSSLTGTQQETERKALLAKHPKLAKSLVDVCLKKNKAGAFVTPMSAVRAICNEAPKSEKKDPAAAAKVAPTKATGQGGNAVSGVTYASDRAAEFDAKFGMTSKPAGVSREGGKVTFSVMTPSEARAAREAREKATNTAAKSVKEST